MPLEREPTGTNLYEVLDRILDKGIVIDAAVRVAVVGIDILGVDARIVVASIETYLRHADAIATLPLAAAPRVPSLAQEPPERHATTGDALIVVMPPRAAEPMIAAEPADQEVSPAEPEPPEPSARTDADTAPGPERAVGEEPLPGE